MDGGSLGRHGLGSSSSWLDGVPFKIGPKFRPPPKVIYQPVITNSCSSTKDEYTFETEEAVLAWARAREEALIKASIEQEAAAKAAVKSSEKESNTDQGVAEENDKSVGENLSEMVASHRPNVTKPIVPPRPPPPKIISEPGAILKPTPIQHLNKGSNHNGSDATSNLVSNSALDVKMFECVDDPFDALELQTLDDMEELKVVLDSSSSTNQTQSSEQEIPDTNPQVSGRQEYTLSEGIYELAAPVSKTGWETFDSVDTFPIVQEQKNLKHVVKEPTRNSESPASDIGDYIDIVEESGINSKTLNGQTQNPFMKPAHSNLTNPYNDALSGVMPKPNPGAGIYKAVLPPITANHFKATNGDVFNGQDQNNMPALCQSVVSGPTSTASISFTNDTSVSVNFPNKPLRIPPPPPVKPNRPTPTPRPRSSGQMWSSAGPSLADSLESTTQSAAGTGFNPYSRHSMDLSDPDLSEETNLKTMEVSDNSTPPSSIQLNKYRPLPPAPSPILKVEKGNQPMGLTDPYNSLSHEAQVFTDRITSMGFRRAKVARAVDKFGQDEKEVFDHLFAVDVLVEKKFAPIHAEAALQSCKNDLEKAKTLLELQVQLEQLGFSSERVRDALVTSDMDHDKALDLLTA